MLSRDEGFTRYIVNPERTWGKHRSGGPPRAEAQKPAPNPEISRKRRVYANFFEKIAQTFCLLPFDTSQEPDGNCSEKPVQMNFFILGPPQEHPRENTPESTLGGFPHL